MLNISFFIATFSSIFWFFYSAKYIEWNTLLQTNNLESISQTLFTVLSPIIVLWTIFILIRSYYIEKKTSIFLYNLLDQLKKNTDTTQNIGRAVLNTSTEIKNNYVFQQFNMLIADINEILSDIIKRSNSISSSQLEHLWSRTAGGERWLLAKTFIEIIDYQSGFSSHLLEKAQKDSLLRGSILEFIARYKTILKLLNEYENKELFYDIIEYGALGKVFDILSPTAQKLSQTESNQSQKNVSNQDKTSSNNDFKLTEETFSIPSFLSKIETETPVSEIKEKQQEEPSIHLRSFSNDDTPEREKEEKVPHTPVITSFTQTQIALHNINNNEKKIPEKITENKRTPVISLEELEEEINSSPENNYDEYAYPFGTWLNDKKN